MSKELKILSKDEEAISIRYTFEVEYKGTYFYIELLEVNDMIKEVTIENSIGEEVYSDELEELIINNL